MQRAAARRTNGQGFEATGVGGLALVAWSPADEAIALLCRQALSAALDPGAPEVLERAVDVFGREALLTRSALRDDVVVPLRQATLDAIGKAIALGVARLEPRKATQSCAEIVRRIYEEAAHLKSRIEAKLASVLAPAALLVRIDAAIERSDAPLAVTAAALRRLADRTRSEAARIEEDLVASRAALRDAEERLRVRAVEAERPRLFGADRTRAYVVREVQVSIPKLTDERLAQIYLPAVKEGLPLIERTLLDRAERLEGRLEAVKAACESLGSRSSGHEQRTASGRVRLVGVPERSTARAAAVDTLVQAVGFGLVRELRDAIVVRAQPDRLLADLIALISERVRCQAPVPSVDEALLKDQDPERVAFALDRLIRDAEVPVSLEPGADRGRLKEWRCRVLRVPPGSRVAEALMKHAGYGALDFACSAPRDRIEVLCLQPGISIVETRLFRGSELPYREESGDLMAPPLVTFADETLQNLVRRLKGVSGSAAGSRRGRKLAEVGPAPVKATGEG
jgi:hypothetical protein